MRADRPLVSSPYFAFSVGAPVITVSAPLRGKVPGVLAADLKLDTFSDFVQAQRPGEHGIVVIFDSTGSLIAHPDFAQFVTRAMTHPSQPQLPDVKEISSGVAAAVLREWQGRDHYDGEIRDDQGRDYLFRLSKLTLGEQYSVNILLLAAQEDFVQGVRKLQLTGLILAIIAGAAFVPVIWIFGGRMSRSLKSITAQAVKLQNSGCARRFARHVLRQGNPRTWQHGKSRSARHMVVRALCSQRDRPAGARQLHLHRAWRCQGGDHRRFHRRPRFYDYCRVDRPRHPHAPDIPLFLRAHGSFPCRRRNRGQVHWRRRHGVLERTHSSAGPRRAGLPGSTCGQTGKRKAQRSI